MRSLLRSTVPALVTFGLVASGLGGCAGEEDVPEDGFVKADDDDGDGKADTSVEAVVLDFEFDGQLVTDYATQSTAKQKVQDQLLYTIGHLNGDRSVGRLDRLEVSNVVLGSAGGKTTIGYHARMPVAWGNKASIPTSYAFKLPKDVSAAGQEAFTAKYAATCVDYGAHDVDAGSYWYYYRPARSGCSLAAADLAPTVAAVTVSTVNTTGKYPEYHKVWEDGAFKVVSVFGKYEDGATTSSDAGIAAYNEFIAATKTKLSPYGVTTVPATIPSSPGVGTPDITFKATLPGGKTIEIVALLVDNVRTAGATFDTRYGALSTRADVIAYNGHAGLGANVRALARKGKWVAGQYAIFFMNGCDTFAYVDGYMAEERAGINLDDPTGTKYMEIVTNAMPAFFADMPEATMALVGGLMKHDAPKTYEGIFTSIAKSQVVLVTGEQDNVYVPGFGGGGGGGGDFTTVVETASASQGETLAFQTAATAGTYKVSIAHDPAAPGGDADLYVKVGTAPTTSSYDCRPYQDGSVEECIVTLASASTIHAHVNGYASGENAFVLTIAKTGGGATAWTGIDESGITLAKAQEKRWETPTVAAGRYEFVLSGTGDADLYVKIGSAPTTTDWTCRPYRSGSNETCVIELASPTKIGVMARGYATTSTVKLVGRKL